MDAEILEIRESWEGAFLIRMMEMRYGDPLPRSTEVGSVEWFRLLHVPDLERFKFFPFLDDQLDFLVRRESRESGDIYFTAYKRIDGKLKKVYLGKPSNVTLENLHKAGKRFYAYKHGIDANSSTPKPDKREESPPASVYEKDLSRECASLQSRLVSAYETIDEQQRMIDLFKEFNVDKFNAVTQVVTQWSERAKGKQSHRDRTWQHALHLLRELNAALKIDLPGSAEEQPAEGGN